MTFFARMVFLSVMIVSAAAVAAPATETAAVEHTIEGLERSCNDAYAANRLDEYFATMPMIWSPSFTIRARHFLNTESFGLSRSRQAMLSLPSHFLI